MNEALKQYIAFLVGNLGFSESEQMAFGLCNAPVTFQRLMQNCLGELNLMYCLIYLDDMIVFSKTEEEHLQHLHVVFECFWEHILKLKPSKCEFVLNEINYLAYHVSKEGVQPTKESLKAVTEFALPQTYTEIQTFLGLVGHFWQFIMGFAWVAQLLHEHLSQEGVSKKNKHVLLTSECRLPLRYVWKHVLRPLCWLLLTLISHFSWKPMLAS